jgi:phosphatidylglycerophosphatase A
MTTEPASKEHTFRTWLMSGFGMGYMPVASGTFGSAMAIAIALAIWAVLNALPASPVWLEAALLVLILLASIGCVAWGQWACAYYADRCRKPGDPGHVVLDEFAGQWVALFGLPMLGLQQTLAVLAVQFFLFRLFDVLKLPPARQLERLPHGWGILCDDLAAGVIANMIGQVIFRALWTA